MVSTPLTSTTELHAALADRDLRIIDCRFDLADPAAGARSYAQSRIPHARYVDLNQDLSEMSQVREHGRHPLPGLSSLAASLSRLDITRRTQIVAYDQGPGAYAARLWWLLRSVGYTRVSVLDGGLAAWQREQLPLESGPIPGRAPSRLPEQLLLRETAWVDAEALWQGMSAATLTLIDARATPRFRGEIEPLDTVAGHIPGALNRPYLDNLDSSGRFKDAAQLRVEFEHLLGGRPPTSVVHMCGSGVTACHNRLAMDLAGLGGSRLYPDSWSGWITDPTRPIATGD
jgi:thiosulfate/3-mercaptopyruvate sulfurtransferase